jgi:Fanconi-associated nuclease 1
MVLKPPSPAKHESIVGQRIKHPKSTNFDAEDNESPRSQKRVKREQSDGTISSTAVPFSPTKRSRVVPDSDADSDDEEITANEPTRKTNLEDALPTIKNEQEAIDEYEASRAAEAEQAGTTESRLNERKWVRGRSSIYVDAFNLALETVLEEERHLFDEAEKALFGFWEALSYEAQYLFVCSLLSYR